jgi:putative transcriptional regulator
LLYFSFRRSGAKYTHLEISAPWEPFTGDGYVYIFVPMYPSWNFPEAVPWSGPKYIPSGWPALIPRISVDDPEALVTFIRQVFQLQLNRKVRNIRHTPETLGDAIGVTRQTIIAIEQGRYSPSLESAFRIARVFGTGVEDVFMWNE